MRGGPGQINRHVLQIWTIGQRIQIVGNARVSNSLEVIAEVLAARVTEVGHGNVCRDDDASAIAVRVFNEEFVTPSDCLNAILFAHSESTIVGGVDPPDAHHSTILLLHAGDLHRPGRKELHDLFGEVARPLEVNRMAGVDDKQ